MWKGCEDRAEEREAGRDLKEGRCEWAGRWWRGRTVGGGEVGDGAELQMFARVREERGKVRGESTWSA